MGGNAHIGQTFVFHKIDFVNQSCHLRGFQWSRLFSPGPFEFGESAEKGGKHGSWFSQ
jgi:hypothetical protein